MSLNRFKKKTFEATRRFTDREKPRESFWKLFHQLDEGTSPLKVLVYYGFGGIGKTTLLKSLKDELKDRKQRGELAKYKVVFVSLEAFEFNSPTDILIAIRNQLEISSVLFDYALLRYWSATGHSVLDMKKKPLPDDSILWEVIDMVADGSSPYKFVKKGLEILQNKYHKTFSKYKEMILEIESLDEMELSERLPYYLGLGLHDAYERENIKHIIFLDTYEAMLRKLEDKVVTQSTEQWIMDLIGCSEVALFVLGSREFIKWADNDKDWETVLEQHILGVLINKDADYFLQSVPIPEQDIREAIVETANGIPLYLDLCVTIYENKKSRDECILPDEFRLPLNQVIERFLRHLSMEEREAVKILGLINFFDYDLFKGLIQGFYIGFPLTLFDSFTKKSFIHVLDAKLGLFKVHDSIREHIRKSADLRLKQEVWDKSLEIVAKGNNSLIRSFDLKKKYFAYILSMLHEIDFTDINNIESILAIGFHLIDNGHWNDVGALLDKHPSLTSGAFKEAYHLLNAVYLRRKGCLSKSKAEVAKIREGTEWLGRYVVLYQFSKANILRLGGEYDEAEKLYKQVIESVKSQGEEANFYIKASRQYADLLFLRGKFRQALGILDSIQEIEQLEKLELAETLRIKGHIYRFNMMYDTALNYYFQSLEWANELDSLGLVAKIYTNLTETYCWINPMKALDYGEKALRLNESLDSPIEIGKIYCAMAIAETLACRLDRRPVAKDYVNRAFSIQEGTGYRSGVLFSFMSQVWGEMVQGNQSRVRELLAEVLNLLGEINVYRYLPLVIHMFLGEQEQIKAIEREHEWLSFSEMKKQAEGLLAMGR